MCNLLLVSFFVYIKEAEGEMSDKITSHNKSKLSYEGGGSNDIDVVKMKTLRFIRLKIPSVPKFTME